MKINFSDINLHERPILILKKADGTPIGVLGNATNVEIHPQYNELSTLSFNLPYVVDGEMTPFYEDVVGHTIIELKGLAQFVVSQPQENGDKITLHKEIQANSLESEFVKKKITLPESTYKFFDSSNRDGTALGMIMELMPNWHIGSVAGSLYNKYRTFDVNNENLYNFIKGTIQQAFNCIFEFDTLNRAVNVRDADDTPAEKQVFISRDNLARDIVVTEETEDMVTRLDVSGDDSVDIREVNPTGTNQIINLDYFMTTKNFDQELIDKYYTWKELVNSNRRSFYNYSIQYSMRVSEELAENAKLADLRGEYTSLENIQAVIIQGIASGQQRQEDLDEINRQLAEKNQEIEFKKAEIDNIAEEKESTMEAMIAIRDACAYENYFALAERKKMDVFIFDNSISETSFVASEIQTYTDGAGNNIANANVTVTGTEVEVTTDASGSTLYSMRGGSIDVAGIITGSVISAVFEKRTTGKTILSVYMNKGSYQGTSFPSGCVSISGEGTVSQSGTTVTSTIRSGYLYFSLNASEYEKRTVAWDLYEYGESLLEKMAVPTYSFVVDSANFVALEQFELFKNELELGQRIYIQIGDGGRVLKPVCIGAELRYSDKAYLKLDFNDTFTANDSESKLIDILDNSISMGKTLSAGKFTYEAWTGSGASSDLHNFITSALDTAKNAIMSSTEQAVSWDGAGLRLRKYSNEEHTAYEPEQIWINNNSILMTADGWATAKMAIGKISDENVGDRWGIIAELIVGTMIAGEALVIESQKKDGGTAVFRMDEDGCRLYNAEFSVQKSNSDGTTTQIILDPATGVAMGTYPLLKQDGTIDEDNAKFYVDPDGTMHLSGTIISNDGLIGGWTIAEDGLRSGKTDATSVGMTSSGEIRIWAGDQTAADAPFYVKQDGTMHSTLGEIGGWYIGDDFLGNASTRANSSIGLYSKGSVSTDIAIWLGKKSPEVTKGKRAPFMVTATGVLYATDAVISGTIDVGSGSSIAGWYIGKDYIGSANTQAASVTGLAPATGTSIAFWAGGGVSPQNANFRVDGNGKVNATDMNITGGSISISDGDTVNFSVNNKGEVSAENFSLNGGNITLGAAFSVTSEGYVTASSGQIGGWYISSEHIGNNKAKASSTVGIANAANDADKVFWAGNTLSNYPKFYVQKDGSVYAKDLDIDGGSIDISLSGTTNFSVTSDGVMTAKTGNIGGWYFLTDYLGNENTKAKSTVGLSAIKNNSDDDAIWVNKTSSSTVFHVTGKGKMYASNVEITGGSIVIKSGGTTKFEVESDGDVTCAGSLTISGNATVSGKMKITGELYTGGNATISGIVYSEEGSVFGKHGKDSTGFQAHWGYMWSGEGDNMTAIAEVPQSAANRFHFWAGADWPEERPDGYTSGSTWAPFSVYTERTGSPSYMQSWVYSTHFVKRTWTYDATNKVWNKTDTPL